MTELTLRTERLGFRLWAEEDCHLAAGLWGDPEVMRLLAGQCTEKQIRERLAREISHMQEYRVQ